MATINAVYNNSLSSPGYDLTLGALGTPPGCTHYRVICRDPEGKYPDQTVRGTDKIPIPGGGTAAHADYEFPQFRSAEYRLEMYTNAVLTTTVTTGTLTGLPAAYLNSQGALPLYSAWIQSIETPSLNEPCFVEEFKSYQRQGRVLAEMDVLGRSNPVVVTDVVGGRKGSFTFWVGDVLPPPLTTDGVNEYEQLMEEGRVMLFRAFDDNKNGVKPLYFILESFDRELITKSTENGIWRYDANFTEVDRPATGVISVSNVDWDDVKTTFATWTTVNSNRGSWLAVLQDPTL